MTWKLFLDDERSPAYPVADARQAFDSDHAIEHVLLYGLPEVISFDHDLGKNVLTGEVKPTAMKFMWFLIEGHLDGLFDLNTVKRIIVHSRNPDGAKNLQGLWDGFAAGELTSGVCAELIPRRTLKD